MHVLSCARALERDLLKFDTTCGGDVRCAPGATGLNAALAVDDPHELVGGHSCLRVLACLVEQDRQEDGSVDEGLNACAVLTDLNVVAVFVPILPFFLLKDSCQGPAVENKEAEKDESNDWSETGCAL